MVFFSASVKLKSFSTLRSLPSPAFLPMEIIAILALFAEGAYKLSEGIISFTTGGLKIVMIEGFGCFAFSDLMYCLYKFVRLSSVVKPLFVKPSTNEMVYALCT